MSLRLADVGRNLEERRDRALRSPLHDTRTAAILGIALGVAFTVCFVTGLYSHLLQRPPSWFTPPTLPANTYRVTQGLHVATGLAAIPLLLAKLWVAHPRLIIRPPVVSAAHLLERLLLVVLVSGAVFQLFTGTANVLRWYPWRFFFPTGHYWAAWVTMGALLAHLGAKSSVTADAVRRRRRQEVVLDGGLGRRGFLAAVAGAAGLLTVTTVGQTVAPLRHLVLFAPRRPDIGVQGLPVNATARGAGVVDAATDPAWRLSVVGEAVPTALALDQRELAALPQREEDLPIACVEGWSAGGRWRGVAVSDLLLAAGVRPGTPVEVQVRSLEVNGLYASSILSSDEAWRSSTLLALELNGEPLHLDHGAPCRLIAANRPGVLQTKWVTELVVR